MIYYRVFNILFILALVCVCISEMFFYEHEPNFYKLFFCVSFIVFFSVRHFKNTFLWSRKWGSEYERINIIWARVDFWCKRAGSTGSNTLDIIDAVGRFSSGYFIGSLLYENSETVQGFSISTVEALFTTPFSSIHLPSKDGSDYNMSDSHTKGSD